MAAPVADDNTGVRLAKNFSMLMSSQLTTFALAIAATVVIPRFLGAEVIGRLQLATAIWALGAAVMKFGMDLAITKAVARDPQVIGELAATALATRLVLTIPVSAVVFMYALGVGYSRQVLVLLVILGVGALAESMGSVSDSILLGVERVGAISVAAISGRLIAVVGAVGLLLLGFDVYAVAIVGVAGVIVTAAIQVRAAVAVWAELDGVRPGRVNRDAMFALLAECRPYFWIVFFMIAYQQVDTVIISLVVANDAVLGWYSVYDRLAGTLMFVPAVFMTVVYPTLSRLYGEAGDTGETGDSAPADHRAITRRSFRLMLLISVPAGFGLAVLARPLVELLYGEEFSEASAVVAVGAIVISLTYLTTVFSMFLISMDRQRPLTVLLAISAVLTIPLDIALVPFFEQQLNNGAVGGVVAYAVTESLMLAGTLYLLPRGSLGPASLSYAIRVVMCGALMVAAVYPLRNEMLLAPIAAGVMVYLVGVLLFRLLDADDRASLASLIPNRFQRT